MSEKREAFDRLFPGRAAKVSDAIRVAGHCLKSHMDPDVAKLREFREEVREAMEPFNAPKWTGVTETPPEPVRVVPEELTRKAEGGATIDSEIRWAIDMIRRGDTEGAESRLKRCLTD